MSKDFIKKIDDKKSIIGVLGMGYVGLPLILEFNRSGFKTIGFDLDKTKIDALNSKKSYIKHIPESAIKDMVETKKFLATTNFDKLAECDACIICVPTPLTQNREPDLSYVINTTKQIKKTLRKGQLISLESTTYPGTMDELIIPILLENSDFKVGKDIFVSYSPEREDPANPNFITRTIPKIVGGTTSSCTKAAKKLYSQVVDTVVTVSSTRDAEMTKLLENIFRSVNIALVNELKVLADKMDIDIWSVIDAASTKPFGFMPFYPGPGLGGHCIPIDPFYLTWKAREYKMSTRFIELAGEINSAMPSYVLEKTTNALNERGKALKNAKILVLGAAYKKNVDDMRESPSLELIQLLRQKGAKVTYNDPHIPKLPPTRKYNFDMKSQPLTEKRLAETDAVLVLTGHEAYDYDFITKHANLIIDTRNATSKIKAGRKKIVRA